MGACKALGIAWLKMLTIGEDVERHAWTRRQHPLDQPKQLLLVEQRFAARDADHRIGFCQQTRALKEVEAIRVGFFLAAANTSHKAGRNVQ